MSDDLEAENADLRRRAALAEARLQVRQDAGALPAGEGLFRLTRGEVLAALVLIGAACAARAGLL